MIETAAVEAGLATLTDAIRAGQAKPVIEAVDELMDLADACAGRRTTTLK